MPAKVSDELLNSQLSPEDLKRCLRLASTALECLLTTGLLPTPVMLNRRVRRWPRHEIEQVLEARNCGLTDDEVRLVVRNLLAARAARAAELRGVSHV